MASYEQSIFINCPFDKDYRPVFDALVFAVIDCGFEARCAKEATDSGQVRIDKIIQIIRQCKFGIHDISRTELDKTNKLPRFNMPLELGIFLGAKEFGSGKQKGKLCLVLDREQYRFQKFCSDIAGQDISAHDNEPGKAISVVRDWLRDASGDTVIPSGSTIAQRYELFRRDLPDYCRIFQQREEELTFKDFKYLINTWLQQNGWQSNPLP